MKTGSSGTLIGWKSGQTTYFPLWDRMEGAWLWTLDTQHCGSVTLWYESGSGYADPAPAPDLAIFVSDL